MYNQHMIRILTDSLRGEAGYGGPSVPIRAGVEVDDVRKDLNSPSGVVLAYYAEHFPSKNAWLAFVQEVITKPSGTALDDRLSWETP